MSDSKASPMLSEPCPKCGARVAIRSFEGRCYTKCLGPGCFFGFDATEDGQPLAACPACGKGRLKTTSKGKVCADCGSWVNRGAEAGPPSPGLCPKCGKGRLAQRLGQYGSFVSCPDRTCGLIYDCDESGRPQGGACLKCGGPMRKTKGGSLVCAVCGTWQDATDGGRAPSMGEARPPRPKDALCPGCRQPMRTVWTRKGKWAYRCDACGRWLDAGV